MQSLRCSGGNACRENTTGDHADERGYTGFVDQMPLIVRVVRLRCLKIPILPTSTGTESENSSVFFSRSI